MVLHWSHELSDKLRKPNLQPSSMKSAQASLKANVLRQYSFPMENFLTALPKNYVGICWSLPTLCLSQNSTVYAVVPESSE